MENCDSSECTNPQVVNRLPQDTALSLHGDHCHLLETKRNKNESRFALYKLLTAFGLCILFMVGEIVGGILANSISIQTDAAHMAADIAGFFFSIVAVFVSNKSNILFIKLTYVYLSLKIQKLE